MGAAAVRAGVFSELARLSEDRVFLYEQAVIPPDLRVFLISLALVREGVVGSDFARLHEFLKDLHLPSSVCYVSRKYAPAVYAQVDSMCANMGMKDVLIFTARKNNKGVRTVEVHPLPGGFNAIIFGHSFVRRCTEQEIRAVVARSIAKNRRRYSEKKNLARKIWWGLAGSIAALGAVGCLQIAMKNGDWWQHAKELIGYHSTSGLISLLGVTGCGVIAELVDRYLSYRHRREADTAALKAFGGSAEEYSDALRNVEIDEALYRQRIDHHYSDYYRYIEAKIADASRDGHLDAAQFLKKELHTYRKRQVEMPVLSGGTSISKEGVPSDYRVARGASGRRPPDLMQPKKSMSSEDDTTA